MGVFVDLGRFQAVASTLGIRWRGFPAWFPARAYHMAMMPGFKRRLRLTTDCAVGLMFPRDASELGQLGHPPSSLEDQSGTARLEAQSAGGTGAPELAGASLRPAGR